MSDCVRLTYVHISQGWVETHFPTSCAAIHEPVVFTSRTRLHCSMGRFSAATQFTMPAKQQRILSSPSSSRTFFMVSRIVSAFVTSHGATTIFAAGKSFPRAWMADCSFAWAVGKSNRAIPERPCSRRARAEARASLPAPPVTVAVKVSYIVLPFRVGFS